jgi:hypothetical protein
MTSIITLNLYSMRNLICYLLFFISTSSFAQPVIQWQKTYGGSGGDIAGTLVKSSSGFVISGTTSSTNDDVVGCHGNSDVWTIWINDAGGLTGSKCYGGSFAELSGQLCKAPGGYVQSAMSASNNSDLDINHGDFDFWIFKTSETGSIVWQKALGGTNVDQAHSVLCTADGGYIIAGNASSNNFDVTGNHGLDDYWVVKLNSVGNVEWQRSLGGSGTDKATAIIKTLDGGYLVAGSSSSIDGDVVGNHGSLDYWVVKLSATGAIQWQRSLGGNDADEVTSIQQTPDGGYIVGGVSNSISGDVTGNHGGADIWVVKLSATGSTEWKKCYGGTGEDQGIMIRPVTGGGYILLGTTLSSDGDVAANHGGSDIWLSKLSSTGAVLWQRSLGGSMDEFASDVMEVGPDEYMVLGTAHSYDGDLTANYGNLDYWVVKLKCSLNSGAITGASTVCVGASVPLVDTASGGVWSSSGSNATVSAGLVTGITSGTSVISYTVTNACGTRFATQEVTVLEAPAPVLSVSGTLLIAPPGFSLYRWYKDSVLIVGAIAAAYDATTPGNYSVQVTGPNGCTGTSPVIAMAPPESVLIGSSGPVLQVVPNPARTTISIIGAKVSHTEVFNSIGAVVRSSNEPLNIQIDHLPAGIYYISAFDEASRLLGRLSFVKE